MNEPQSVRYPFVYVERGEDHDEFGNDKGVHSDESIVGHSGWTQAQDDEYRLKCENSQPKYKIAIPQTT